MEDVPAAQSQLEAEPILRPDAPEKQTTQEKTNLTKYIIIGLLICAVIGMLYYVWKYYLNAPNYLIMFLDFCNNLKELTPLNIFLMTCVMTFCQFSFVPGQSTFIAVVSYFIGDFFVALTRCLMILFPLKIIGFFLVRSCLHDWAHRKFKDYDVYKAIKGESQTNPWTTSLLMNSLFLVASIKMYVIPLLSIKYYQFIPTLFFGETLYISMNVLVGVQIRDIQEFIEKGSSSITNEQKWAMVGFAVFGVLTGIFLVYISIKVSLRVAEMKKQEQEQQQELRGNSYELHNDSKRGPEFELV